MNNRTWIVIGLTVLIATAAFAAVHEHDIRPTDFFKDGFVAFSVDGDAAPGFLPGSFQAPNNYSRYGFTPMDLFGRDVTIGELTSISYYTKKNIDHLVEPEDWFVQIFTNPYGGSPGDGWYGHRINAEPRYCSGLTETSREWTHWVTDAGQPNRLRFYDSSNGYGGSSADGFLDDLTADPVLAPQTILAIDVTLTTAWGGGFSGRVDGLVITLSDGDEARVNFVSANTVANEDATWSEVKSLFR